MHFSRRLRVSPAMVVATIALFTALAGGAYALTLAKNSVGAKQIRSGAVRSAEVKDKTLTGSDFAAGTLLRGPEGQSGQQGPPGEPGTARAFAFVSAPCAGPDSICELRAAHNVVSARRPGLGDYCIKPAAGIDVATSGSAAGVDFRHSESPEGNGSAMAVQQELLCESDEFQVRTTRIPSDAVVTAGVADTEAVGANDVAFWILVP